MIQFIIVIIAHQECDQNEIQMIIATQNDDNNIFTLHLN